MHNALFDFDQDPTRTGFRLERFELFNWGTFNGQVWTINVDGHGALLTGDIGSGKSTIVDALTTLLVAPQRITYNKAAGAEGRERNLLSYVLGHYKSEKDDERLSAKAVSLRGHQHYTVLLAHFLNRYYDQHVTLAQMFWVPPATAQPERMFLVAEEDLNIRADFSGFDGDVRSFKRRLRERSSIELFDSFTQYSASFRRKLGIASAKAMDLFYQTVSMKSVGNLTEFVRNHMLEAGSFEQRVREICSNFENLNQAHLAVVTAKRQVEMLTPLVDNARIHHQEMQTQDSLTACRDVLHACFASHKAALLSRRIEQNTPKAQGLKSKLDELQQRLEELREQQGRVNVSIYQSGGQRLGEIDGEIKQATQQMYVAREHREKYQKLCDKLELPRTKSEQQFYANRLKIDSLLENLESRKAELTNQHVDALLAVRQLHEEHKELDTEIRSLSARQSNLPRRSLDMRQEMCSVLGVAVEDTPFVGELLQVREDQQRWRGAIERLLHGFGLSMIVPDSLYAQVSRYVDQTHLRGKLVYFRVREQGARHDSYDSSLDLLWRKIEIKPDSLHYAWLESQLAQRFDHVCCDDMDAFRRHPRAITAQGQVKSGSDRHEKDDRHRIDDISQFILGWSNQQKLAVLKQRLEQLANQGRALTADAEKISRQITTLESDRDAMRDLLNYQHYKEIHWETLALRIEQLSDEKKQIETSNDLLQTLRRQLGEVVELIKAAEQERNRRIEEYSKLEHQIEQDQAALLTAQEMASKASDEQRDELFPQIHVLQAEFLGDKQLTLQNCDASQTELREGIQRKIDASTRRINALAQKIIGMMSDYKYAYPLDTRDMDASLQALGEYQAILDRLVEQDLPRHEERFKTLLNEGTIQEIALLQSQLDREGRDIKEKISQINQSLRSIDYNPGSYIRLDLDPSIDQEIRTFRADLRACLGDTLGGQQDELYTEQKFLQVKAIVDRFQGRPNLAELDRKWTLKVTDVRNWFEFSASELWQEDDTQREFYSDSSGKSGGQKEKLAYTILASALAYQFGLKLGETQSRSFRFVMIDEAFGRGSDESARYGLDIFRKLNLQLLVITPLQKIHVIEDYVSSVHFVHNEGGQNSQLRSLSIQSYRDEKQRHVSVSSSEPES